MSLPLTVVGGFLGAGKTTLVNHLLASGERRWGVLVNDFGAVNIDAALIANQAGGIVELSNGCVCCSLSDDLGMGLAMLTARVPAPEHILVEASGVSDPWRIAELALIEPGFELEPLLVMADAVSLAGHLGDPRIGETVRRQLEVAEIVGLTRTDLADPTAAEACIRGIRPEARIVHAPMGKLDAALLHFVPPPRPRASRLRADAPGHGFYSMTIPCEGPYDRERLRAVLGELPRSVLRVKGFCRLGPEAAPHLLQFAATRWAFSRIVVDGPWALVVIGTEEVPGIREAFAAARVPG